MENTGGKKWDPIYSRIWIYDVFSCFSGFVIKMFVGSQWKGNKAGLKAQTGTGTFLLTAVTACSSMCLTRQYVLTYVQMSAEL